MRQYKSEGWESLYKTLIYLINGGKDIGTLTKAKSISQQLITIKILSALVLVFFFKSGLSNKY